MPAVYPDNEPRAVRLGQLADDVVASQRRIGTRYEIVSAIDIDARQFLNAYIARAGATTFEEIEAQALSLISDEELAAYQDMKRSYASWADQFDTILQISSTLVLSSFVYKIAFDFTAFYRTVGVARVARTYMRGFKTLLTVGWKAGIEILKAADEGVRACAESLGALNKFTDFLFVLREVSRLIIALGVVADGAILIYQAIEGSKQKVKLIEGIHNLQITRLASAYIERITDAIMPIYQNLSDFVETLKTYGADDPYTKTRAAEIARSIARVETRTSLLATEVILEGGDGQREHYSGNDLSREEVIAGALADIDLTNFAVFPGKYVIANVVTGNIMDQAWLEKVNGTPIIGHSDNGGDNQRWTVSPTGNSVITLKNVFAGSFASPVQTNITSIPSVRADSKMVDWWVKPAGSTPGAFIIQANILDSADPLAGTVMELQDGSIVEGTLVVLREQRVSNTLSQEWRFVGVEPSPVADGIYFVNNAQYQSSLWDQWGAATEAGTPINANWLNFNPNQQWVFKSYGNGIYTIINGNGSYASFIQTNETALDGTLQANYNPSYWKISPGTGKGYYIQAVDPTVKTEFGGTVLALTSDAIGVPITFQAKQSAAALNQQWTLRKVTPLPR